MRFPRFTLRYRLILLVILAGFPALGLIFYTSWYQRRQAAEEVKSDALVITRLVTASQDRLINAAEQLLVNLAELPEVKQQNSEACNRLFQRLLEDEPVYVNFGAIKANGELFCSAHPYDGSVNYANRTYFQRALKNQRAVLADYQPSRERREATINLAQPFFDERETIKGVVFAKLNLNWLVQMAAGADLPRGSTVTVVDGRGMILARSPDPETWVGKTVAESSIMKAVLSGGEGAAEDPGNEGNPRLFAFSALSSATGDSGVQVVVGIPSAVAYAEVTRDFQRNLVALGGVLLLLMVIGWVGSDALVLRRLRALVAATRRLGSGDLQSRTGLPPRNDEVGELTRAFDGMAANLQLHADERRRASEKLERTMHRIRALHEIDVAIVSSLDLNSVLEIFLQKVELFVPYATTIRLLNKSTGELEAAACRNIDEHDWKTTLRVAARGLTREVLERRQPIAVRNVQKHPETFYYEFVRKHSLVSFLGLPLIAKGELLGTLSFYSKEERDFADDEVEFLETLASQAAVAIHNSQLYEETRKQADALRNTNIELEKSSRVKTEFLSVMSHEFRTPLNLIMGYAGMMQEALLGPISEEQRSGLDRIVRCSDDLLAMIMSILQANSLEADAMKLSVREVSLNELLAELEAAYPQPVDKDLLMAWQIPPQLPAVRTDREKLKHVLQNLIGNAIKFTDRGQVAIMVQALPEERRIRFEIADTGPGIPSDSLPIIFEMFRQLDSSMTRPHGGVGLGLYIVKKFTEMIGGEVRVESEFGKGTRFIVSLPLEK